MLILKTCKKIFLSVYSSLGVSYVVYGAVATKQRFNEIALHLAKKKYLNQSHCANKFNKKSKLKKLLVTCYLSS